MRTFWLGLRVLTAFFVVNTGSYAQLTPITYDQAAIAYQKRDFTHAEKIWSDLASEGNANAQYALAVMHLKGEASKADNVQAFQLLKQAAEKNHLTAIFNLGVAYWEGTGTSIDKSRALNWWEIAARGNDSGAQFNLGLAYYIGDGRDADVQKAKQWIEKAVQNGHPQAPQLLSAIQRELSQEGDALSNSSEITESIAPPVVALEPSQNTVSVVAEPIQNQVVIEENPVSDHATSKANNSNQILDNYWQTSSGILSIRARPNATAIELKTLKPNTPIKNLRIKGDWMQIQVPGNYAVWAHGDFLSQKDSMATITGNNVNVRPLPEVKNPDAAPVGRLNSGDKVAVILGRDGWVKIIPQKPLSAWILSRNARQYRVSKDQRAQEWVNFSKFSQ